MATDALATPTLADRHSELHFDEASGTHWVRGRTYKASASADGFSYIPFLGSKAPKNYPVHLRLESVERSGTAFELDSQAIVVRENNRMILDRGDVEVRYDLAPEQVEQSFAFTAPGGSGDVTLHIAVETELVGAFGDASLRFSNSLGAVSYGEAIVLDDAGRVASVASRWDGHSISLTVPAAFVDSAQGAIVVDPILATELVDGFAEDLRYPDLAYSAVNDSYLIVYEEIFSGTDTDVFSIFVEPSPFATSSGGYIELGADTWTLPKVAQQRNTQKLLVVAQAPSTGIPGSTDIVARFRLADGTLEAPFILKGATSFYGCETPDIGSEGADFVSSYYCVVYSRDYGTDRDVAAILIDVDGNYVGPEIVLASTVSEDESGPVVSKSTGPAGGGEYQYNVAWVSNDLNLGQSKVEAVQVNFDGSVVSSVFDVAPYTSTTDYFDVEVSSLSVRRHPTTTRGYWVVSYDDTASIVTDAFLALCSGTTVHSTEELQVIEHHSKDVNDDDVVMGTLDDSFIFAYRSGLDLFVTIAQPIVDRLGMTERRISNGAASPNLGSIAIATTKSGGGDFNDGLIVWSEFDGADDDIAAAFVFPPGGVISSGTQYCYGMPNSTGDHGFILALGDRSRFSPQTLIATSLPLNSFGFFIASSDQGLTPGAGGSQGTLCVSGSVGRFGTFNSGSGGRGVFTLNPQMIPQPTGPVSALAGQTWNFQTWHRDSVGGAATSNFTNAVAIPFF